MEEIISKEKAKEIADYRFRYNKISFIIGVLVAAYLIYNRYNDLKLLLITLSIVVLISLLALILQKKELINRFTDIKYVLDDDSISQISEYGITKILMNEIIDISEKRGYLKIKSNNNKILIPQFLDKYNDFKAGLAMYS